MYPQHSVLEAQLNRRPSLIPLLFSIMTIGGL
jgi:hypothetical protein